jgi:hypothetical protein
MSIDRVSIHAGIETKIGYDVRLERLLGILLLGEFVSFTANSSEIESKTDRFLSNSVHVGLEVRDASQDVTPLVLQFPLFGVFRVKSGSERFEFGGGHSRP